MDYQKPSTFIIQPSPSAYVQQLRQIGQIDCTNGDSGTKNQSNFPEPDSQGAMVTYSGTANSSATSQTQIVLIPWKGPLPEVEMARYNGARLMESKPVIWFTNGGTTQE